VHAELVEKARDLELVLDGQADSLALGPVAKGGVEELDLHGSPASKSKRPRGGFLGAFGILPALPC
jgi:hypothetical protein